MKETINSWLASISVFKYIISTVWLHVSGRWFIFRDVPEAVVKHIADKEIKQNSSKEYISYITKARQELELRRMNKQRNRKNI